MKSVVICCILHLYLARILTTTITKMSRASPLIRALPRSTVRPSIRSFNASSTSQATSPSTPTARPTTPRRVAVPASATRISRAAPISRTAPKAATQTSATPRAAATPAAVEDDFDYPIPEAEGIDDYANLAPSPSVSSSPNTRAAPSSPSPRAARASASGSSSFGDVSPSPPLTSFPNDGYRPLPTTDAGGGVGLGDNTSDWSTSFSGLSQQPFDREVADALLKPLQVADIELKPGKLPPSPHYVI